VQYPQEYLRFYQEFNCGNYYECHDLLEEIWLAEKNNKFLQGLLQLAVGLYHFESGNLIGCRLMFQSAIRYLKKYLPEYWGLQLLPVITFMEDSLKLLPQQDRVSIETVKKIPFPRLYFVKDEMTGKIYAQRR
jgi:hypothetical protein